ncbi:high light inducible protein [Prochlorococcus phage P-RSM4]|uniref:High light inducible protein n=3 Tax=Kyanoviridae TaxID=2946160 RepID=E3SMA2_9CAUD|nr:high light inducible protein [Prochlorococcus phage P-RSM4]ADO98600.1 high light inducible protein [Prochlorococcus phage P-RSM4]|tara:strand:- start:125 stop:289 length:165 start_codon:yes stop_codon:yes gene_type:complete
MELIESIIYTQSTHNRNTIMTPEAERFNGWAAMLGFVAAVGAYVTTGQIIPGIF